MSDTILAGGPLPWSKTMRVELPRTKRLASAARSCLGLARCYLSGRPAFRSTSRYSVPAGSTNGMMSCLATESLAPDFT